MKERKLKNYQIKERIGKGAYGVVYKSVHNILKHDVAIKEIN